MKYYSKISHMSVVIQIFILTIVQIRIDARRMKKVLVLERKFEKGERPVIFEQAGAYGWSISEQVDRRAERWRSL